MALCCGVPIKYYLEIKFASLLRCFGHEVKMPTSSAIEEMLDPNATRYLPVSANLQKYPIYQVLLRILHPDFVLPAVKNMLDHAGRTKVAMNRFQSCIYAFHPDKQARLATFVEFVKKCHEKFQDQAPEVSPERMLPDANDGFVLFFHGTPLKRHWPRDRIEEPHTYDSDYIFHIDPVEGKYWTNTGRTTLSREKKLAMNSVFLCLTISTPTMVPVDEKRCVWVIPKEDKHTVIFLGEYWFDLAVEDDDAPVSETPVVGKRPEWWLATSTTH